MEDLIVHARMEGDYSIEMADSLNDELGSDSDYVFAYVVHDDVYLCERVTEDVDWRYECEFTNAEGDLNEATDRVSNEVDDDIKFVDFPGTGTNRSVYTETNDE